MLGTGMDTVAGDGNNLPSWRFHVENLGCIKSGDFEVKPLTLLCGPNNTGKTWAMYALYGFLEDAYGAPIVFPGIEPMFEELIEKGICSWDFGNWLNIYADDLLNIINQGMQRRLSEIFNAPSSVFSDSHFDWVIKRETFVQSGIDRAINLILKFGIKNIALRIVKPAREPNIQITLLVEEIPDLQSVINVVIFDHLLGAVEKSWKVFLMPTERNGLHLFYKELAYKRTAMLHPSMIDDLNSSNLSRYAEPIANYIDWLIKIPELLKRKTDRYQGLARQVESLVGGHFGVDTEGNVSFTPNQSLERLDLHLSSSTVKSLFGLWFYLEHQAKPGDMLMIDEPELNLHPANQRALARLLARLVNAGLRVVVSTHSDYIVREINSLIMLDRPHPKRAELMQRFGYLEEEVLNPGKVACYLFDQSKIKTMEITPDEGILASTFDETIHDLNDTSDGIYYTYRDGVEEDVE